MAELFRQRLPLALYVRKPFRVVQITFCKMVVLETVLHLGLQDDMVSLEFGRHGYNCKIFAEDSIILVSCNYRPVPVFCQTIFVIIG